MQCVIYLPMTAPLSRSKSYLLPALCSLLVAFVLLTSGVSSAAFFNPDEDDSTLYFKPFNQGTAQELRRLEDQVRKPVIQRILEMTSGEGNATARRAEYRYHVDESVADVFFASLTSDLDFKSRDDGTGNQTDILNLGGGLKLRTRIYPGLTDSTFLEFKLKNSDTDIRKVRARFQDQDLKALLAPDSKTFSSERLRGRLLRGARLNAQKDAATFGKKNPNFIAETKAQAELILDGVVQVRFEHERRGRVFEFTHCSQVVRKGFAKGGQQVTQDSQIRTTSPQVIHKILGTEGAPIVEYYAFPARFRVIEVKRPEGESERMAEAGTQDPLATTMNRFKGLDATADGGKTAYVLGQLRAQAAQREARMSRPAPRARTRGAP